ncbi:MAG TPA: hypothetical protein VLM75_14905 [Spirochaetota bacterium]|nr:hypothetical protein [Spirochaetota bacterium]
MLGNLLKILLFFFAIYLVYKFIRGALSMGRRNRRRDPQDERSDDPRRRSGQKNARVIELDKDQYKVE